MCGICGTAGFSDFALLKQMTDVIAHRGPDDEGHYISKNGLVALGNRRLSILDLSHSGHMPMCDPSRQVWITYNGEVYNSAELRRNVGDENYIFNSSSDTETVLALYLKYGISSFTMLNGMFAYAIWDSRSQELFIVRDRFGIKPLYFTNAASGLIFGSEVKSLLCSSEVQKELNLSSLGAYLTHLWVPGPATMYKNVEKLKPGHYLRWFQNKTTLHKYWEITWSNGLKDSESNLATELKRLLKQAVSRNLISDVPLGLLLSGGLDSTILLSLMTEITGKSQDVYTITLKEEDAKLEQAGSQDEKYAKIVAHEYGARYHEIEIDSDITSLLPETIYYLDEPVADPASINSLLIARRASRDVKVLLSGQGADEIFGGYRAYLSDRVGNAFSTIPRPLRNRAILPLLNVLPVLGSLPGVHKGYLLAVQRYFSNIIRAVDMTSIDRYMDARTYHDNNSLNRLLTEDAREAQRAHEPNAMHMKCFSEVSSEDFVNQMLHVDIKTFLPELNLTYSDKMGMAASVETRVPYLDNDLVDFMSQIDPKLKIKGMTGKHILRKAVENSVPKSVIRRRKAGFGAPIRKWLGSDLVEMTNDLLSEDRVRRRNIFNYEEVTSMLKSHREGSRECTYQIWAMLVLEIWMS